MIYDAASIQPRVDRVADASGAAVPPAARAALTRWIELVAAWNAKVDLTAARTADELVDLMVADALVLAAHLPTTRRVIDVGAGAGAPGLALAVVRPDLDVLLVEPLQKRVAFLRTAVGTLAQRADLPARISARVERARGEDLARAGRSCEVAISRATLAPDAWIRLGAALTAGEPPSRREVWVLLAREAPPALAGWIAAEDVAYRWPLTGAERRAVRFVPDPGGSAPASPHP